MYINLANIDFGGEGGGKAVLQETTIESLLTETTKVVTPPEGVDGFNKVTVTHAPVETLTEATITSNGETTITPSAGFDATFGVKVSVDVTTPLETWTDVAGMKYSNSTITKFQDGYKFAPRTGDDCVSMFSGCDNLIEAPLFDTSNATGFNRMFGNTRKLSTIPAFNMENATDITYMFFNCNIVTVPELNTPSLEIADYAFQYCSRLTSVGKMDFSNVTSALQMFQIANKLTTLGGFTGLKVNFDLSNCQLLTKESILNVINEAADVTASPKSIYLGATNLAKLTDEEKAIATNKGWTLS